MKYLRKLALWFLFFLVFTSCTMLHKPVIDPYVPFQTPYYLIFPPEGKNWRYMQESTPDGYKVSFGRIIDPKTHGYVAMVRSYHHYGEFHSQDEFSKYVNLTFLATSSEDSLKVLKREMKFDNKFGEYCLLHYLLEEEQGHSEKMEPSVYGRTYDYYFVHPHIENVVMYIGFYERGIKELLSENFETQANEFIKGLKLKN